MKLSSFAVDQVRSELYNGGITTKMYPDGKPTKENPDEYIVINSLPINGGRIQSCFVNVNCHAKDIDEGVPARVAIDALANSILAIIEKKTTSTILIDIDGQELIREKDLGEHYMNLRFSVRLRNN